MRVLRAQALELPLSNGQVLDTYFLSPCLSFLTYKMEIIKSPISGDWDIWE